MKTSRIGIGIIEDANRDVDALGAWLVSETDGTAAGGAKPAPAPRAGIVAAQIALPLHLVAFERGEGGNCGAIAAPAHLTVAVSDAPRWGRSVKPERATKTCACYLNLSLFVSFSRCRHDRFPRAS